MSSIGLVVRTGEPEAVKLAKELIDWTSERHKIILEEETADFLSFSGESVSAAELVDKADPIITLGGDGTLIGVARYIQNHSPVMLGVNFGHLGFLTEVAPDELFQALESVLNESATFGKRHMISCKVTRKGKVIFEGQAVNEALVQKGARARLPELNVSVDEQEIMQLRTDGIMLATPTGSTAYSLAAGGSIAFPSLSVNLLTAICPHSLTIRPLILPSDANVSVTVPDYEGSLFLIIDGQEFIPLESGDSVNMTESDLKVRFVRSPSKSYFEILSSKLNWGVPNRAR